MSRPFHIEFPLADYHVMNRGLAYQAVFTDRPDRNTSVSCALRGAYDSGSAPDRVVSLEAEPRC